MWEPLIESCELVEVRSEETECVSLGCNVSMHEVSCEAGRYMLLAQRLPRQAQTRHKWRSLQTYVNTKGKQSVF